MQACRVEGENGGDGGALVGILVRNRKKRDRREFWLELSSETAAWRTNLILGPENNVTVLKKPGYCLKEP